jgi:hypothetical protein
MSVNFELNLGEAGPYKSGPQDFQHCSLLLAPCSLSMIIFGFIY